MQKEALFETMTREAAAQGERFLDQARREAARIVEQARADSAQRRDDALAKARIEEEQAMDLARERAKVEATRTSMALRQQVAEDILEEVENELGRMARGPEFAAILPLLLAEILPHALDDAIVNVPTAHAKMCRAWLDSNDRKDVRVEPDAALVDGVSLSDAARTYRVTNTLRGRYARIMDEARRLIIERVFQGDA